MNIFKHLCICVGSIRITEDWWLVYAVKSIIKVVDLENVIAFTKTFDFFMET